MPNSFLYNTQHGGSTPTASTLTAQGNTSYGTNTYEAVGNRED